MIEKRVIGQIKKEEQIMVDYKRIVKNFRQRTERVILIHEILPSLNIDKY